MRLRLALAVGLIVLATPAFASKRVALVVGNGDYQHISRLANPRNDARLIADTLKGLGFTLIGNGPQSNLDKPAFDRVVQSFGQQIQGADVALFFYAGHGVQVSGSNYLVPVGANPTREADVDFQMLDVSLVLRQMNGAGTKLNLVILDACRNNPFGGRGLRSADSGLGQMRAPEGTLISFATQPGAVALDGEGGNSPYSRALAETIKKPGLGIFDAFNEVGIQVKRSTGGSQQPWVSSSPIDGRFFFAGLPSTTEPQPGSNVTSEAERAWLSIKDTTNTAILEAYTKRFADSFYSDLARGRIQELKRPAAAPAPAAPASPPAALGAPVKEASLGNSADQVITKCDLLAAAPTDIQRPKGVAGVPFSVIDFAAANVACSEALKQSPNVARLAFQAGRIADAQKDHGKAFELYSRAVSQGYLAAISNLGTLYEHGQGVTKNTAEAKRLYERAAAAGYPSAMYNMGTLYENGTDVTQNDAEARRWYEKGAAAGDPSSMNKIGAFHRDGTGVAKNVTEARKWFEKAAAGGDDEAMFNMGALYDEANGVPRSYPEARRWYEKSAALGNGAAMGNIGYFYEKGQGVARDITEARRWYEKGAAAGNAVSMNNLGVLYRDGTGVPKDNAQAFRWFEKGAEAGDAAAMNNLGFVFESAAGVARDYVAARRWYLKAAEGGENIAMFNLGELYEFGRGVPKDMKEARAWYQKAANAGNDDAKKRLRRK